MIEILAIGQRFESELSYINIKKYIDTTMDGISSKNNFKAFLKDIEKQFQQDHQLLVEIKELNREDLTVLNRSIKNFNIDFDKLNSTYYDKDYLNDGELKQLFSSISRHAHKVENVSHKYLHLDKTATQTPVYIKDGLARFSGEAISNKLTPEN